PERGRVYWAGRAGNSTGGGTIESGPGARGAASSGTARDRVCARRSRSQPAAIVCHRRLWPRGENLTGLVRQRKMVHVRRENEKSDYARRAGLRRGRQRRGGRGG